MDSKNPHLESQILRTNQFYEIEQIINLADIKYNTDEIKSDSLEIINKIKKEINNSRVVMLAALLIFMKMTIALTNLPIILLCPGQFFFNNVITDSQ